MLCFGFARGLNKCVELLKAVGSLMFLVLWLLVSCIGASEKMFAAYFCKGVEV